MRYHVASSHQAGQMLLLGLALLFFTATLLIAISQSAHKMQQRQQQQIAADVTALSVARLQARSLNALAKLNDKIIDINNLAKLLIAKWVYLAVQSGICAATWGASPTCNAVPAFIEFSLRAPNLLKRMQRFNRSLASYQDRIVRFTPRLTQLLAYQISQANGIDKLQLYYPGASHNAWFSPPTLLVQRGPEKDISQTQKCGSGSEKRRGICRSGKGLLGGKFSMPQPLYLPENFAAQQKIMVLASSKSDKVKMQSLSQAMVMRQSRDFDSQLKHSNWDGFLEPISLSQLVTGENIDARLLLH